MQHTHTNTCVITFYALRFPMSLAMVLLFCYLECVLYFLLFALALYFFFFVLNKYVDQSKNNSRHGESATQRRVSKIFFFKYYFYFLYVILLQIFFKLCFYSRNILKTAHKTGKISFFIFIFCSTNRPFIIAQ